MIPNITGKRLTAQNRMPGAEAHTNRKPLAAGAEDARELGIYLISCLQMQPSWYAAGRSAAA